MTDAEVAALGVESDSAVSGQPTTVIDYKVGDMVRIVEGPLENFSGVVNTIDQAGNKVNVTISMFGRETLTELALNQVVRMD